MFLPVYTVVNDCQDCYKCVRACPVKAIEVRDGHARVTRESCVLCGRCVTVCPVGAKRIRDDIGPVRELLASGRTVYASVAPSWVGVFPDMRPAQLVQSLRKLGFAQVSETALGAQEVTVNVSRTLRNAKPGLYLSTACPSLVQYIVTHQPRLAPCLTGVSSPLIAHCKLLRSLGEEDAAIVFFGPCAAKKWEAEKHPDLLDAALTFDNLRTWFKQEHVNPADFPEDGASFFPCGADEGTHYPVEGGMIDTIRASGECPDVRFLTLSGLDTIKLALEDVRPELFDVPVFAECLACTGGCINGPAAASASASGRSVFDRWMHVKDRAGDLAKAAGRAGLIEPDERFRPEGHEDAPVSDEAIRTALLLVGKNRKEDEMNCGGCGYDTCREFAKALVRGRAEVTMCVSYMRRKAQKKANAILRCMPSGVAIVDRDLSIVECNERFASLLGEEILALFHTTEGLRGACVDKLAPSLAHLFKGVLETDQDVHFDHFPLGEQLFEITIFSIEPHQTVGAVMLDVTRRELRRDQIAHRAEEVIRKNLLTVQEIACRLGENMAETEILLRAIAEGYGTEENRAPRTPE